MLILCVFESIAVHYVMFERRISIQKLKKILEKSVGINSIFMSTLLQIGEKNQWLIWLVDKKEENVKFSNQLI